MEAGIVGLPNSGKSTLFNALTGARAAAANYMFATTEPNVGIVAVPDGRLERLARHVPTEKIVPAMLRLVDIPGLARGSSEGEGLGNRFLRHVREVDAFIHVVRCFGDEDTKERIEHVEGSVDPGRDADTVETELLLADMQAAEGALDKLRRAAKSRDADSVSRLAVIEKVAAHLDQSLPVRTLELGDAEMRILRGYGFFTAKKVLYVANVAETDPRGEGPLAQVIRERAAAEGMDVVPVCAKLEEELAELDAESRGEMLGELGLKEPALEALARSALGLLGLSTFYTAGPKEIRAWTVRTGAPAPEAAGAIHSDIQRGFIRAEVYSIDDLDELGSEKAIREKGRMRSEGKSYVLHDADVVHFLFNV